MYTPGRIVGVWRSLKASAGNACRKHAAQGPLLLKHTPGLGCRTFTPGLGCRTLSMFTDRHERARKKRRAAMACCTYSRAPPMITTWYRTGHTPILVHLRRIGSNVDSSIDYYKARGNIRPCRDAVFFHSRQESVAGGITVGMMNRPSGLWGICGMGAESRERGLS